MKKTKVILKVIICIVILCMIAGVIKLFTGVFGSPKYVYLFSYNNHSDGGFVNIKDVESIDIFDKKTRKKADFALKYCKDIRSIDFTCYEGEIIDNVDFLIGHQKLKNLYFTGKSRDWSGLSKCNTIEYISLSDSNFSDLGLISNFIYLSELYISTESELKYIGFDTLRSLDFLYIQAPNVDFAEISKASILRDVSLYNVKIINNSSSLNSMTNLNSLYFDNCDITSECINDISSMEKIKELTFYNCRLESDDVHIKDVLKKLQDYGVNVYLCDNTYTK